METAVLAPTTTSPASPDIASESLEARPQTDRRIWDQHAVDIRLSLPLPFGHYYLTIVAGRERRSAARRASERSRRPLMTAANMVVLGSFSLLCGLGAYRLLEILTLSALQQRGARAPLW